MCGGLGSTQGMAGELGEWPACSKQFPLSCVQSPGWCALGWKPVRSTGARGRSQAGLESCERRGRSGLGVVDTPTGASFTWLRFAVSQCRLCLHALGTSREQRPQIPGRPQEYCTHYPAGDRARPGSESLHGRVFRAPQKWCFVCSVPSQALSPRLLSFTVGGRAAGGGICWV